MSHSVDAIYVRNVVKESIGMSSFPWNIHDTDRNVSKHKNVNSKWKVSKKA